MGIISKTESGLTWTFNGEILVIEPWGKNSLRIRSTYMGDILDTDYALLPPKNEDCNGAIEIGEGWGSIVNGKIKAVLEQDAWAKTGVITYYNQKGEVLLKERGWHGALNLYAREFSPNLGGDYTLTASFEGQEEKLYGMGQYQQEIMDLKYCTLELAHRNSQASVPFVLSSKGYGFLWHNPAVGQVAFGKNVTRWEAKSTKQLDYWITAGDEPSEILEAYGQATGTVPMMPEYGLGFWQCKLRYASQEEVLSVAREYKKRGIPIDVIVVDFFHWPRMGDFRFDEVFFPDPKAMVEELKSMGIELMVSVWPQIDLRSENFEEMKGKNLLVKPERGVNICMTFGGDSVFFDATNPDARKFVWDTCRKNYYDYGIRLFWLDEAEPEYGVYQFDNYRYYMGPNVQVGNIYPQKYSRTFYDGMTQEGEEKVVNLVRCAWAGSQRYGALVWSGDVHSTYEDFRKQICAGLHMGLSGIPWWTTDIGGFAGGDGKKEEFRELLVRWFQYGTFCPVMRLHGDRTPTTMLIGSDGQPSCHTGDPNEVWSYGGEIYEILVRYIKFREQMRDYTRSLMKEAHEKGTPIMRTMFYEFPRDHPCWETKEQYMYGPDLLVAPIAHKGMCERSLYLPQNAEWTHIHTGKTYRGGQMITIEAPLPQIPVFIRDNRHPDYIGKI